MNEEFDLEAVDHEVDEHEIDALLGRIEELVGIAEQCESVHEVTAAEMTKDLVSAMVERHEAVTAEMNKLLSDIRQGRYVAQVLEVYAALMTERLELTEGIKVLGNTVDVTVFTALSVG